MRRETNWTEIHRDIHEKDTLMGAAYSLWIVWLIGIALIIVFACAKPAHAINNPADTTASYGQWPMEFYKLCVDVGDMRWLDLSLPVNAKKDANIYFDNWTTHDGSSRGLGVMVSKAVSQRLQVTVRNDVSSSSGVSASSQNFWVGYQRGNIGANILLPFESGQDPTLSLRTKRGNVSLFLDKTGMREGFFSGISFYFPRESLSLDLAYKEGGNIRYLRLSRVFKSHAGMFIPEIRTRFGAKDEIGFGLAFLPR